MYLAHFGLSEQPFGITPDTGFIYGSAHQSALNTLLTAYQSGAGFIKITGEVGTGKTLLCRRFLTMLDENTVAAYIPNPMQDPRALLADVAEELGAASGAQAAFTIKSINRRLLQLADAGKTALVCIDEAQTMPPLTLEAVRLLSNLETEKNKLVQIVLFGQPELDANLAAPSARQLLQRVVFHHVIAPLPQAELHAYLDHRMQVAGYRGASLFEPAAVRLLHRCSGGTPRLVNILAHKALLAAYGAGQHQITPTLIRRAAADTQGARPIRWWWRLAS
ncbi:MAG: AAA family ATPase [Azonexus sp.]|jgi:MSHA biogenesis protein MshM|nr:AAA family ATPase [Azonexus sp.]